MTPSLLAVDCKMLDPIIENLDLPAIKKNNLMNEIKFLSFSKKPVNLEQWLVQTKLLQDK